MNKELCKKLKSFLFYLEGFFYNKKCVKNTFSCNLFWKYYTETCKKSIYYLPIPMKKILLCVAMISISLIGYTVYAEEELSATDILIADIIENMPKLSIQNQIKKLDIYENMIWEIEIDKRTKDALVLYIEQKKEGIEKKLGESQTTSKWSKIETKNENIKTYEILENTNREEIANYRVELHNIERIKKWLNLLTYNQDLEMSAYAWANTINEEKRTVNFHKREESDNNYSNYPSMKKWFANLGVVFNGEWTEFSENVWRGLYNIKTNNLTEEMKKQIQKTFSRFMNEEKYNGAHYRAIIMPRYTKIWLWISLDPSTKKYYLVTHYSK